MIWWNPLTWFSRACKHCKPRSSTRLYRVHFTTVRIGDSFRFHDGTKAIRLTRNDVRLANGDIKYISTDEFTVWMEK